MGAWTITFMIGFTLAFNPLTPRFLILFPNQPYMLNIRIIIHFAKYCTRNRTRTYNCMASKTTAYANSAIRVLGCKDGTDPSYPAPQTDASP